MKPGGQVVELALAADDRVALEREMRRQGLVLLAAVERGRGAGVRAPLALGRARFPLTLFAQELHALLAAGLNLVEALETLAEKERGEAARVLERVLGEVRQGRTLSRALEPMPREFPALFVATVRASERSGDLPEALRRFIAYQQQMELVRKKVVSASIYPVLLVIAGLLVTLFLLGYVVPKFSHIYADSGRELPFLSTLLLKWGQAVEGAGGKLALVAVVLAGALAASAATMRGALGRLAWRIPAFGERLLIYQLARFYRTLSMLLRGGTPVVGALDMAAGLLDPTLKPRLAAARGRVREGMSLSAAMAAHGLTTPVAARMLGVGEQTGDMADMMERIAVFYDDEVARWVEWFTRLFEPLLMALIGIVIGGIVVLMYLPIFELAGSLQ